MTPITLFVLTPLLLAMLACRRTRPPVAALLDGRPAGSPGRGVRR